MLIVARKVAYEPIKYRCIYSKPQLNCRLCLKQLTVQCPDELCFMNIISAAFCGLRIKVVHGCFLAISSHFPTAMEEVLWEVGSLGKVCKNHGISDVTACVCITMCCGSVLFRIQVEEYEKGYGKGPYGTREVSLCRLDFLISKARVADFREV